MRRNTKRYRKAYDNQSIPLTVSRRSRKCKKCGCVLSVYNPNKYCWSCLRKKKTLDKRGGYNGES